MSQDNTPKGTVTDTAAPSQEDNMAAIADLLDDSDLEPNTEDEDQDHGAEGDEEAEADEADAEPEGETDEEEQPDESDSDDDPDDIKGGRFAPDSAKVKLEDGRTVSIADLKRGTLLQPDYTRKMQALAEERKTFESHKAIADDFARKLASEREFLLGVAQTFLPKPPDRSMMDTDPIGYMQAKAAYDEQVAYVQHLRAQFDAYHGQKRQETEQQAQERKKAEAEKLFEAMPDLRNRENYAKFWSEAVAYAANYGLGPEELDALDDHRAYLILRDAMEYRKLKKAAPKVKEEVQRKPVLKAQKRMDPKARSSRDAQARLERLRRTGSSEDGVASLMDLDL